MEQKLPLWLLLFCALVGSLFTVAFGWAVKSTVSGSDRSGTLGEVAVQIASFPTLTKKAVAEVAAYATGSYRDEAFSLPRETFDLTGFGPVPTSSGIDVQGLLMRAASTAERGWRVLLGAFVVDGEVQNASLLLSPELRIVRAWVLKDTPIDGVEPQPMHRLVVHGAELLDDASLIFTFDGAVSLQRIDSCGGLLWAVDAPFGRFHHTVSLDDDGTSAWTFSGSNNIVEVSTASGNLIREFSMQEIISANPEIDILEILRLHPDDPQTNNRNTAGEWMEDSIHVNDVEPLPAALSDRFEKFEAGDLLVSARSLNLVFVVDPETLRVKWWRIGATQRQHDPDWQPNGEITILNNRMSRDFSEIVAIDPTSFRKRILFDGRTNNFYTRVRGKHQVTPSGHLIVTSSQQGRAFEVSPTGEVVLEFINTKPGSDATNYVVSELKWLPPAAVEMVSETCEN